MNYLSVFSTDGRFGRQEFLCNCFLLAVLSAMIESTIIKNLIFPQIIVMYLGFVNIVKRLHDINCSGYWAGLIYSCALVIAGIVFLAATGHLTITNIPKIFFYILFGIVFLGYSVGLLLLFFKKGTDGTNKYGIDPIENKA